jgi:hypothetical protein
LKSEGRAHVPSDLPLETSNWKLGTSKLGSFCTFRSPAGPRPTRQPPLPTYPSHPKFGFVLHNASRQPPPAGPNWVRFARLASSWVGRPRPTSSAAGRDWVRFARFTPRLSYGPHDGLCLNTPVPPQVWLCSAHLPSGRGEIGFVSHGSILELGSFCTITLRRASRPAGPRPFSGARAQLGSFGTIARGEV